MSTSLLNYPRCLFGRPRELFAQELQELSKNFKGGGGNNSEALKFNENMTFMLKICILRPYFPREDNFFYSWEGNVLLHPPLDTRLPL